VQRARGLAKKRIASARSAAHGNIVEPFTNVTELNQARPQLLAASGREPSDTAAIRERGAQNRGAAGTVRIEGDGGQANRSKEDGGGTGV